MKAYEKIEFTSYYFDDMEKILNYLRANGKINVPESEIKSYYEEFSEEKYAAGWISLDDERLREFADWLSEIEI